MSKYLVTGGAGFLGSHLVDYLIKQNHEVVVLDDLSSGKKENINNSCEFMHGCITDSTLVRSIFNKNIDFCYHLAAVASVQDSINDWLKCHNTNLAGTVNVFNEAAKKGVPVIYASSSAIYGNCKTLPISENSYIKPETPYGLDKYCCELQADMFYKIYGLRSIGLRFFNIYGKRQAYNSAYSGVVSIFLNKLNNNQTITVFGDGKQERDFIFVKDAIRALHLAKDYVSVKNGTYNVCTGHSVSINQLIDIMSNILDVEATVNYLPSRKGDIYKSLGNSTNALEELNFQSKTRVLEGLRETII